MQTIMKPPFSMRLGLVLGITAVAWAGGPAWAMTAEDVVTPWRDQIATCSEAMDEIAYQADMARSDIDADIARLNALAEAIAQGEADLAAHHDYLHAMADLIVTAAPGIAEPGAEGANLPRIGWGIFGYFEQRRDETNAAIREAEAAIAEGTTAFGVQGHGDLSRQSLAEAIAQRVSDRAGLDAAVDGGSFAINYPELGLVTRPDAEACIAEAEGHISETFALIAAGEYTHHIPHLGFVTRNTIEAMIAETQAQIDALAAAQQAGALVILRPLHPVALTAADLDALVADLEARSATLAQAVADGSFQHGLPVYGVVSRESIAGMLAALAEATQTAQAALDAGTYMISAAHFGGIDRAQAEVLLNLPDCRINDPRNCLGPGVRSILQDALVRIPLAAGFEIALLALEIDLWEGYAAVLDARAAPEETMLALARRRLELLVPEFDRELAAYRSQLSRRLDWLGRARDLIP